MAINPGEYNRRITIEELISTGNTFGSSGAPTYRIKLSLWAKTGEKRTAETTIDDSSRASQSVVFTVPYTSKISIQDRIFYDGKYWKISSLIEIGYRELLQIGAVIADEAAQ